MYVFGANRRVQRAGANLEELQAREEFTPIDYRQNDPELDFGNSRFIRPQDTVFTDSLLLRQYQDTLRANLENYQLQLENTPVTDVVPTTPVPSPAPKQAEKKTVKTSEPKPKAKPKAETKSSSTSSSKPTISKRNYVLGNEVEREKKALADAEKQLIEAQKIGDKAQIAKLSSIITNRKQNIKLIEQEMR